MRDLLCSLFLVFCTAGHGHAQSVDVMTYGDSITKLNAQTVNYPEYLQIIRPDLTIYNRGRGGDVSWNITRFDAALAERQWEHVVILIGVNDIILRPDDDPHDSFQNIWVMAQHAKNAGAEVWLMTPTPVDVTRWINPAMDGPARQAHTLGIANEMAHRDLDNAHSHVTFLYLRDAVAAHSWEELSIDGLHPNDAGRQFIAQFVAGAIP